MHNFDAVRRDSLIRYLQRHLTAEVRFDDVSRKLYATDASHYQIAPLGVVIPRTLDDLVTTVQITTEMGIPITARGAGTSLSGQAIGAGVVLDCCKYLKSIGEVDVRNRRVRVQPGVVLEHLNQHLAPYGLQFGPDVATINRATLGGMIGNNSAGSRSIIYGKTVDHTRSLRMVLADGQLTEFAPLAPNEWEQRAERKDRQGIIYREVGEIVRTHADEIHRRFPQIVRRVSGYNLAAFVSPEVDRRPLSMVPLLVGSEGTLGVIAEAELELVPRPTQRGLLVPHFDSLESALNALAACLEFQPSAVELMDSMLIDLARTQHSLKETMAAIHGRPAALLMVEFQGNDAKEVSSQVYQLQRRLQEIPGLIAAVPALDPALRDPLWKLRSAAVPLLYGMPGDAKPITFVEDTAVAPERLPEFALRFREVLRAHGTDGAFYGHASVGCLHIRPVLNLKSPHDLVRMQQIMTAITDLVLEFGGSLSGEHGDGLVRSEWNRKMYGPVIYDAFCRVKAAFDPENRFNPGKIVHGPPMTDNLRPMPSAILPEMPTIFDYSKQEGFFRSIELCNGAGVCRKTQGGAMCPSYRATLDERESTRGRANALRLAMIDDNALSSGGPMKRRWLHDVMDLCLSCKACKSECPSNVDLAKLKAEFQHAYYAGRLRPLGHYLAANVHHINRLSASMGGVVNAVNRLPLTRWMMEKAFGIDRRRSLPEVHSQHFRHWFRRRKTPIRTGPRVILLDDCLTTYQEPLIGRSAVEVLEAAGFQVELAGLSCCGRALLSKGFLVEARRLAAQQVQGLAERIADGTPILGLEPSCLVALKDEWPELVPGSAARRVAAASHLAEQWLASQGIDLSLTRLSGRALYHPHCHQRAVCGVADSHKALNAVSHLQTTTLDVGCCGMAGAFGYEREHYDISVKIAGLQLLPALRQDAEALVIASGTSCRHQIRDLTGREALHPMEVLARALPRTSSAGP